MGNKILFIVIGFLLISCSPNKKESNANLSNDTVHDKVLILPPTNEIHYKLNRKATIFINDSIIGNRTVAYCFIDYKLDSSQTSIGFHFGSIDNVKSYRVKLLSRLTNRFLIVKDRKIPILFPADEFSDLANDKINYLDEFNMSYIILDYQGRIIEFVNLRK